MVSVTDSGGTTVSILSATVSGAGFNSNGVGGQILAPAQNASMVATFAPAAAGTVVGSIVLLSTAVNSPTTISLVGAGIQPGSHSVSLSWSESSANTSGFNVYRGIVSGGPYSLVNLSPVTPAEYLDITVITGNTYYYVVSAVDSLGNESAYSTETSATNPSP
jgi:fibronectin type 3 domain-containing protein